MIRKKLLLAAALSASALSASVMSQAQAQDAPPAPAAPAYQPYYVQQSAPAATSSSSSSYAPMSYSAASSPFAPIGDRIVSDPLYLPLKSQIYGTTAYSFGQSNSTTYNSAGIQRSSGTSDDNTVTQTLAYGISDEFSLHISEAYEANTGNTTSSSTGITSNSNNYGFIDPTFGATWRVIDQARYNPVDLDLTANYTPNMFTDSAGDESHGVHHDGTVAAGRQSAGFTAAIGREMKDFSISGSATATYLGDRNYSSSDTGDQYTAGNGVNYNLNLATQTRFTDRLSLNVGVGYNFVNGQDITNTTTGSYFTASGASYVSVPLALNYHFIPNRLVGSLTYDYLGYTNNSNTYPAAPTSDTSTTNHNENVFGARLAYVFN